MSVLTQEGFEELARLGERVDIQLRKPVEKAVKKPSDGRPITEAVHPEAAR